jgi:hypothetical protein
MRLVGEWLGLGALHFWVKCSFKESGQNKSEWKNWVGFESRGRKFCSFVLEVIVWLAMTIFMRAWAISIISRVRSVCFSIWNLLNNGRLVNGLLLLLGHVLNRLLDVGWSSTAHMAVRYMLNGGGSPLVAIVVVGVCVTLLSTILSRELSPYLTHILNSRHRNDLLLHLILSNI